MNAQTVHFTAPRSVEVREEPVPDPGPGEAQVDASISAISPGTEMVIYRGEAPPDKPIDTTLDTLSGSLEFPLRYGYAAVGTVETVGQDVDTWWIDRQVLAYHPHASRFVVPVSDLVPIGNLDEETAALLPNMETAVNFVLDGGPYIGERVAVFGQGVVGLLTTSLLARFPLATLLTLDLYAARRDRSRRFGADVSVDPTAADPVETVRTEFADDPPQPPARQNDRATPIASPGGADLTYELTGDPTSLRTAIDATRFDGRVVIGSWYGTKTADLGLGGRFHRSRIDLITSQVSSIDPALRGRWTTDRRLATARQCLKTVDADQLVTHRIPVTDAARAYHLLDRHPEDALQVLIEYD